MSNGKNTLVRLTFKKEDVIVFDTIIHDVREGKEATLNLQQRIEQMIEDVKKQGDNGFPVSLNVVVSYQKSYAPQRQSLIIVT